MHTVPPYSPAVLCCVLLQVSEHLLVKYSCLLSLPVLRLLLKPGQLLISGGSVSRNIRAMAAHHSQWVWWVAGTIACKEVQAGLLPRLSNAP
jgi:hypothetical protein